MKRGASEVAELEKNKRKCEKLRDLESTLDFLDGDVLSAMQQLADHGEMKEDMTFTRKELGAQSYRVTEAGMRLQAAFKRVVQCMQEFQTESSKIQQKFECV